VRRAALLALAAALAGQAFAQPVQRPDMWAAFAEIMARHPNWQITARSWQRRSSATGAAAMGWDQSGIDVEWLLEAIPGGLDTVVLAGPGPPGEIDAELRTNRPLAEIVPAGWTEVLRFGEIDLHPRHASILAIASVDRDHLLFARGPRWRQGATFCAGPVRGVAVYRRTGAVRPADLPALELWAALRYGLAQGQAYCTRFEGDEAGLTQMRFLADGRPLVEINRRLAGGRVTPKPLAWLFERP